MYGPLVGLDSVTHCKIGSQSRHPKNCVGQKVLRILREKASHRPSGEFSQIERRQVIQYSAPNSERTSGYLIVKGVITDREYSVSTEPSENV